MQEQITARQQRKQERKRRAEERRALRQHGAYAVLIERGTSQRWWVCPNDDCRGMFIPLPGHQYPPAGWECPSCQERREQAELLRRREAEIAHVWERFADVDEARKKAAEQARIDAAMRDRSERKHNGNGGIPPGWQNLLIGIKEELQARLMQAMDFDFYEAVKEHRRIAEGTGKTMEKAAVEAQANGNRTLKRTREAEAEVWKFEAARLGEILDMDSVAVERFQTSIWSFIDTALRMTHGGDA